MICRDGKERVLGARGGSLFFFEKFPPTFEKFHPTFHVKKEIVLCWYSVLKSCVLTEY